VDYECLWQNAGQGLGESFEEMGGEQYA